MGAVPKRKISKRRKGKRRADINLQTKNTAKCPSCGNPKLSHIACSNCGTYKN
ncbi:50S ribosomal protein L32 [Patescibacteria group bacterium]